MSELTKDDCAFQVETQKKTVKKIFLLKDDGTLASIWDTEDDLQENETLAEEVLDGVKSENLLNNSNTTLNDDKINVKFQTLNLENEQLRQVKEVMNADMMVKFVEKCRGNEPIDDALKSFIQDTVDIINRRNETKAWMRQHENMSEMALQQMVYPPFTSIIASFGDLDLQQNYLADEHVYFSSYIWNPHESAASPNGSVDYLISKPDGGLRVVPEFNALCLLELKRGSDYGSLKEDIGKSVLGLSITAEWMRDAGCEDLIQLPFVVGNGRLAQLFVVRLESSKKAESKQGEGTNEPPSDPPVPKVYLIQMMGWHERKKLTKILSMLAYLLGKAVEQLNDENMQKAINSLQCLTIRNQGTNIVGTKNNKNGPTSKTRSGNDSNQMPSIDEEKNEENAVLAASLGGQICDLEYPFARAKNICAADFSTEEQRQMNLEYFQQESPFYFVGKMSKNNKDVFCKLWRDGDRLTHVNDIKKEMEMMKLANSKGVPCPDLLEELCTMNYSCFSSSSSSSGVYHIIVMTKLRRDKVLPKDALTYSIALVSACLKLHNGGVLHCDLKPSNLSWDGKTLTLCLLDFGHAQLENGARCYGGTRGYEAPEIVKSNKEKREPHSRASDAYSVGKTLLTVVEEIRGSTTSSSNSNNSKEIEEEVNTVQSVAEMLCKEDVSERLSLIDAESKLLNHKTTPVNSPTKVAVKKGSPNSVMNPTPC